MIKTVKQEVGRWQASDPTPKTGWTFFQRYRPPVERFKCEMCAGRGRCKIVHIMQHASCMALYVGTDCAGRMEGDPAAAQAREAAWRAEDKAAAAEVERLARLEAQNRSEWHAKFQTAKTGSLTAYDEFFKIVVKYSPDNSDWQIKVIDQRDAAYVPHPLSWHSFSDSTEALDACYSYRGRIQGFIDAQTAANHAEFERTWAQFMT